MAEADRILRICVDLNIWVCHVLSAARGGRSEAAAGAMLRAVRTGRSAAGPIQLIVSHTMLLRLADVLIRKGAEAGDVHAYVQGILNIACRGPSLDAPYVVLGGGVEPTEEARPRRYDPYDPGDTPQRMDDEDGRVLDTAIAGRAHVLATLNFNDFRSHHDQVIEPGFIHVRAAAHHRLLLMHADRVAQWLRTGVHPDRSLADGLT